MSILSDARAFRKVVRTVIRSRKNGAELARRAHEATASANSIAIAVYFADSRVNLYQLRQWYEPLLTLSKKWPVTIISRSVGATLTLLDESPVPVVHARKVSDLDALVNDQEIRVVFYVNQNSKNFQMFRYGRILHVFINHGESDKMYMTTNQFKAYDYSLVAGEAARSRLNAKLWNYDVAQRTLMIGRPQADYCAGETPFFPDERTVVLYAPTWEGDREAAAYGSIASHGVALVDALVATGRHRVIYRPHPRSGVLDREYREANQSIIAAIAAANEADPAATHVFDNGPTLGWQLSVADVAITDVSAMVYDRLAVGRPLIVTRPQSAQAEVDQGGYLGACEWLDAADAANIVAIAERVQHSAEAQASLEYWVTRHFGDTSAGASTERFHAAVEQLIGEWERHALEEEKRQQ
jgi:hypothetical protein